LHKRCRLGIDCRCNPTGGVVGHIDVDRAPVQRSSVGQLVDDGFELVPHLGCGEHESGMGVRDDGGDSRDQSAVYRRMHRYCDRARVEAPEDGGDEVEARGAQDENPFPRGAALLQSRRDCSCPMVQSPVSELIRLVFAIA
jgi:hypothetical protein